MDQPIIDRRHWEGDLTHVPYWVYQDPELAGTEQARLFEGPVWNFLCLEVELPGSGDWRTTFVGSMPVVVCAYRGRIDRRVREPLRAPRRTDLPG